MDYRNSAKEILLAIGGKENLASAAHCSTRLRLIIGDNAKIDKETLENIDVVKGVFESAGQLQIIIGTGTVNKVYDEFIDPRGRELKNETRLFLNFAMTVFRDFSKYKALFLANATNLYNCYFSDFEILPKYRITKFSKLGIKLVMYDTSEQLYNEHKHSILGRQVELIEGANNSSLENNFDNQFDDFIAKLSKKAKYRATLRLDNIDYGLYQEKHYAVVSNKADLSFTTAFAMRMDDASDERPVIDYRQIMIMINNFKNGQLRFSDVKTRSQWLKFFKAPYANSSSI